MADVMKELTCPACGKTSAVRVPDQPSGPQKWHCPLCKKIQSSEKEAVAAAPDKS